MSTVLSQPAASLARRYAEFRTAHPTLRIRDAARLLDAAEAQLVALGCGDSAVRLAGGWGELIRALPSLGPVLALTRNDHAVHEKTGVYENIQLGAGHGLVLGEAIDLRVFLAHWRLGFAVTEETRAGPRRSLQFFDRDGVAVHKVYLTAASDAAAYERLVGRFTAADQGREQPIRPRRPAAGRDDHQIDRAGLHDGWRRLRDTHEFFPLLRRLGVARLQALRLAPRDLAWPVARGALRRVLTAARDGGLEIMVFVGSPGVIQIHTGPVRRLVATGDWYNVLDPGFDLHLRESAVASAWVVVKPTADGEVTSLELYDDRERAIALLFGRRKPGQAECGRWRALLRVLSPLETAA